VHGTADAEKGWEIPPRPHLDIELALVTPAIATELKDGQLPPRNPRPGRIAQYARDIATGHWMASGETVIFDDLGKLVSGWHRLTAIEQAGKPVWLILVRGVPEHAYEVVDSGSPRSLNDTLRKRGLANVSSLGGAIRFAWLMQCDGLPYSSVQPTRSELLTFLDENPGLIEAVTATLAFSKKSWRWPGTSAAPVYYYAHQEWPEETLAFFYQLRTGEIRPGEGIHSGMPSYSMRRWLDNRANEPQARQPMHFGAVAIKAINAHIQGKTTGTLTWTPSAPFPKLLTRARVMGWTQAG